MKKLTANKRFFCPFAQNLCMSLNYTGNTNQTVIGITLQEHQTGGKKNNFRQLK